MKIESINKSNTNYKQNKNKQFKNNKKKDNDFKLELDKAIFKRNNEEK